jgi:hypothetical protein
MMDLGRESNLDCATVQSHADDQTLPFPSDKRPSTGLTVDRVAHHVSSSGMSKLSISLLKEADNPESPERS